MNQTIVQISEDIITGTNVARRSDYPKITGYGLTRDEALASLHSQIAEYIARERLDAQPSAISVLCQDAIGADIAERLAKAIAEADKQRNITSLHDAYGLLLEELDEFWDEVKKKPLDRHPADLQKELFDIMAVAWRVLRDLVRPMFSDKF